MARLAAVDHLRRRAPYLRQDGTLLVADASGRTLALVLRAGALETRDPERGEPARRAALRLDPSTARFEWRGERHSP
jgi:hypothetical protein